MIVYLMSWDYMNLLGDYSRIWDILIFNSPPKLYSLLDIWIDFAYFFDADSSDHQSKCREVLQNNQLKIKQYIIKIIIHWN